MTFADKFSYYKTRVLLIFWAAVLFLVIRSTLPFLMSLYETTKAKDSYYSIVVSNNAAFYTRVTAPPDKWVPLKQINKRLQGAIISSEDGKFYLHPGYDLEELRDAIHEDFVLKKKKKRGASTITQQLVKNLYLSRDRTMLRKAHELVLALMLEKRTDKNKILEIYLNVIEYGQGIFGIKDAAKYYFNKAPKDLRAREAAFLAMLLPSPVKYAKSFKNKMLTPFAKRIVDSVLLKMKQGGYIGEEEYYNELNSRFSWEKAPLPQPSESVETEEEFIND